MATRLGIKCKVYYGAAGSQASTLLKLVRDATLGLERSEHDASVKDAEDWEQVVAGIKKAPFEFEILYDPADTGFLALRDAWLNNTPIALLILDGLKATVGSQGLDADFAVLKFERGEPIDGLMTIKCSVKPTLSSRAPAWTTIAA